MANLSVSDESYPFKTSIISVEDDGHVIFQRYNYLAPEQTGAIRTEYRSIDAAEVSYAAAAVMAIAYKAGLRGAATWEQVEAACQGKHSEHFKCPSW